MPIWSLTAERLEKLKDAIARKKAEHDELLALTEKDLWCRDLDDFSAEWERQAELDREIQTDIRRMGRRASKKMGQGRGRKPKGDDDYAPVKPKKAAAAPKSKAPPKAAVKTEAKSAQRFADALSAQPKTKKEPDSDVMELSDDFSDNDFAALSRSKPAAKPTSTRAPSQSVEPVAQPSKRAVASKARALFDADSESEDDGMMLGDVGAMVKGIGKPAGEPSSRLSLYAMSRPESSGGLPKMKSKPSKTFDEDSMDDTNYEMLAKSSPHKASSKDIDDFLSDDEPAPPKAPAGLSHVKKARPAAASKGRAKEASKPAPKAPAKSSAKSTALSPAAKAYAAKKGVKASAFKVDSDDEDEDDVVADEPSSPPPKPAARGRPGRAAAARRPIVVDDDDEDSSMAEPDEEAESSDPFGADEDD